MALKLNGTNSVAAPAYAGADADTGLQCGTDEVNLVTGGTARLYIDSSGKVGIGSTSPEFKLMVADAGYSAVEIKSDRTSASDNIGGLHFKTVSTSVAYIQSLVDGTLKFRNTSSLTERMRIDTSGRLLVGTSSSKSAGAGQYAPLNVQGYIGSSAGGGEICLSRGETASSITADDQLGAIVFADSAGYGFASINCKADGSAGSGDYPGRLEFKTAADGSGSMTERMRIDSSGRLLVGTTSALADDTKNSYYSYFQVKGNTAGSDGRMVLATTTASASVAAGVDIGNIYFLDSSGGEYANIKVEGDGGAGTNDYPGRILFSTTADGASSATERMRIDSSGNVGIGVSSPDSNLHIPNNGSIRFGNSGATAKGDIAYSSSGAEFLDIKCQGTQTGFGNIRFYTGGTPSEAMRIDSSGQVGIGTTSPQRMLHIAGGTATGLKISGNNTGSGSGDGFDIYVRNDNNGVELNQRESSHVALLTSNTERMRITSSGYLRASADTSDSEYYSHAGGLHVISSSNSNAVSLIVEHSSDVSPYGILIDFTDDNPDNHNNYFIRCADSSENERFVVYADGDVVNHDNSYGGTSDQKLKQDIVDAESQWDDLKDLRVRKFKFKSDVADYGDEAKTLIGLVAQEAETVCPGLVVDSPDVDEAGNDLGTVTKSIRYSVLYMKAVKALQEAQTRIEALETQQADLLARVTALEAA